MSDFTKIAQTEDIPEGAVKVYDLDGEAIALCHVGSSFYAVQDLCTHDGGPLGEGELIGSQIECPTPRRSF